MTKDTDPQPPPTTAGKSLATVKFRSAGKQYDFDINGLSLQQGDSVVVETNRGRALGTVARPPRQVANEDLPQDLKKVLRLATEADQNMARISASKEKEAYDHCFERIAQRKMPMKLVKAEYLFDGSKIIFYFTADGRVDFRELVKDLAHHFHTRIEMRQIGVRDEAKLIGGIGICGRELCCGTFLTDFHPVSVRMAKQQGLALNPSKISGQCGRLLCCLGYEYDTYCKMSKKLPKPGTKVTYEGQPAEVLSSQTLNQQLTLRCEGKVIQNVPLDKLSGCKCPKKADGKAGDRPSQKPADKSVQKGDKDQQKAQKTGKAGTKKDAKTSRPPRTKSGEPRPSRGQRPAKAAEGRPPRQKKAGTKEGQRPQRTSRPVKGGDQQAPKTPPPSTEATEETVEQKNSKRRSRRRRRPPRKP